MGKREIDSNSFEHDYIIRLLESFVCDLATDKPRSEVIDKTACILTAFMQGQISGATNG